LAEIEPGVFAPAPVQELDTSIRQSRPHEARQYIDDRIEIVLHAGVPFRFPKYSLGRVPGSAGPLARSPPGIM